MKCQTGIAKGKMEIECWIVDSVEGGNLTLEGP